MLNPLNLISKFIKSSNQKELDRIAKIVEKVNFFENSVKEFLDEDFPKKTRDFIFLLFIFKFHLIFSETIFDCVYTQA